MMKKLLLLALPLVFLMSCKDDKEELPAPQPESPEAPETPEEPAIPEGEVSYSLQGKWVNELVKRDYYGDADTIVYADSAVVQAYYEFKGNKMIISLPGDPTQHEWVYDLPDEEKPNYITLTQGDQTTDYEILSISDTAMVWEDRQAWAGYPIDVPDEEKKTSKEGVFTYKFSRMK